MYETHITSFHLENFKQFENLDIENIGQFNIITGDNNTGKTSVLEALLVERSFGTFKNKLSNVFNKYKRFNDTRNDFFLQYFNSKSLSNIKIGVHFKFGGYYFELNIKNNNGIIINEIQELPVEIPERMNAIANDLNFIPFYFGYEHRLTGLYSQYINKSQTEHKRLIDSAKAILKDINDIRIDLTTCNEGILLIGREGKDVNMPLGTFGDGFVNTFRLLIEIVHFSEHRIMVDEIDSGIYYKRMKDFWKTVLKVCKLNKVQLFATTHNNECIKFFEEAISELGESYQNDSRIINLYRHQDDSVKAYTYTYENFKSALTTETEVR